MGALADKVAEIRGGIRAWEDLGLDQGGVVTAQRIWTNAMMVNVREASVTNHAFLERMFVEAALWDPGLGDIAIAKYETRDHPIYKAGPRLYDRGLANGEGRVSTSRTLSASWSPVNGLAIKGYPATPDTTYPDMRSTLV